MKQEILTYGGKSTAQRFIGALAVAALVAVLAFSARQLVNQQTELARRLAEASTIGRLEYMDRINYTIRLMNQGRATQAKQELQASLDDEFCRLNSELPLANPEMQSLAKNLCRMIAQTETVSISIAPQPPSGSHKSSEGIDQY